MSGRTQSIIGCGGMSQVHLIHSYICQPVDAMTRRIQTFPVCTVQVPGKIQDNPILSCPVLSCPVLSAFLTFFSASEVRSAFALSLLIINR